MCYMDLQAQVSVRMFGSNVLQASGSVSFMCSSALQTLVSVRIIDRKTFR